MKEGRPQAFALEGNIDTQEAKVLENRFVHRMTLADSVIEAGIPVKNRNSAASWAHQLIAKHKDANSELLLSFQRMGINPDTITRKIRNGMNATMKVKRKVGKDLEVFEEVPDYHAQHKYVETAVDIMGGKAPKKHEVEVKSFEQRLLEITMKQG